MKLPRDPVERRYRIEALRDGRWKFVGSVLATSPKEAMDTIARTVRIPVEALRLEQRR